MTEMIELIRMLGEVQSGMDKLGNQTTKLGDLAATAHDRADGLMQQNLALLSLTVVALRMVAESRPNGFDQVLSRIEEAAAVMPSDPPMPAAQQIFDRVTDIVRASAGIPLKTPRFGVVQGGKETGDTGPIPFSRNEEAASPAKIGDVGAHTANGSAGESAE
jgi:hypothetical protein